MDYLTKEEEKPLSVEEEILGEHQKPRIRLNDGLLGNLHDLIFNGSCTDCNGKLEWETFFHSDNEHLPTAYIAKHCRRIYSIADFSVGVRVLTVSDEDARKQVEKQKSKNKAKEAKQEEKKDYWHTKSEVKK